MNLRLPAACSHPIRIVEATEISSVADFYERFANEPLIIRGLHLLRGSAGGMLPLDRLETLLGNIPLHVYDFGRQAYHEIPAASVFSALREGRAGYNIVDHFIVDTALGDLCETPSFLRCNWLVGPPVSESKKEKSVVLSSAGSFTPLHLDAYGMQGWMYLFSGRKTWELMSPEFLLAAFDPILKEFFDPRRHSILDFPLLRHAEKHIGTMCGGELLYFPAGWIHQVETPEASHGFGGSVINDFQIEAHMRWWLWERTLRLEADLDLGRMIREMPPERFASATGRVCSKAALAYLESWEQRMRVLHGQNQPEGHPDVMRGGASVSSDAKKFRITGQERGI